MMAFRQIRNHFDDPNLIRFKKLIRVVPLNAMLNHSLTEPSLDPESSQWCERALPKLIKLTHLLKDLDFINGRLVNVHEKFIVNDDYLKQKMHSFKSLATTFLGCQSMQQAFSTTLMPCVNKPIYKELVVVDSLKKVCNILGLSAQHRKLVRLAICPQVTKHQIWTGALQESLNQLQSEMGLKDYDSMIKETKMTHQIVVNCLKFLDATISYDPDSTSWMRLVSKKDVNLPPAKWEDFLEMLNDLIKCCKYDQEFPFYVTKLETMKEGLLQIKDVLVDKNIGYKEARHQESLVQKKLTKSLGHSSKCLFTLLLYYLYDSVDDIELDVCSWFSENGDGSKFCLCVGKILTSDEEKMVQSGIKQLDRALGVIKFVHEISEMKEVLELQGHLWCVEAVSRSINYRGNKFFIHRISL